MGGRRFTASDAGVHPGDRAEVLLRPEELEVVPEGGYEGVVETCSFFGSYFEVLTRTAIGPCRLRVREALPPGQHLSIGWPDNAGIAYPANTGS